MPWPIVGHEWAVDLLRQSLAAERASHAYLLCGPPQVGKTTLARTLAQALNCTGAEAPCGRCSACSRIARDVHPDVQVISGRGSGGRLLIEQVRALQHDASLAPYEGRRRVFILRQMDLATIEACNALLKTLEEPPARVALVLTATRRELLLPTIVSRCQVLELRAVPPPAIERALAERGVGEEQARLLARISAGRVGWALEAARDESILQRREQDVDLLFSMLSAGTVDRLEAASKISRDLAGARRLLDTWAGCGRDLLLLQGEGAGHVVNADQVGRLAPLARALALSRSRDVVAALQQAALQLAEYVNPRLAIEELLLRLPRWQAPDRGP